MEVIKQNEQFTLNKVLENGWVIEGNATKHVSGNLSFWMHILKKEGEGELEKEDMIGDISYSAYHDGRFDLNCSTVEENRAQLIQYVNPIINEVLDYFK